jgi:hypothetical protein
MCDFRGCARSGARTRTMQPLFYHPQAAYLRLGVHFTLVIELSQNGMGRRHNHGP